MRVIGSGKSNLVKVLGLMRIYSEGEMYFMGKDVLESKRESFVLLMLLSGAYKEYNKNTH